ncbi:MAG: DNA/RNA non-specific endonuclease [Candidatus Thiodiazotropha sp.]
MSDPFQIQRELRYGAPVCDEILIGRYFTIGYSWYFRQAKWVLEIVNPNSQFEWEVERRDNFRADIRIPRRFRAGLKAYKGSGYDRGHLIASANHDELEIQNSETFLLSNMSPQKSDLNRQMWRDLEIAVRKLNDRKNILETYVLTAPVFYFDQKIVTIGDETEKYGIDVPVPHAFVKSVLAEDNRGRLKLWTFEMENKRLTGNLEDYLVVTYDAEQKVGGRFWDRVAGGDLHSQKRKPGKMWELD